MRKSYKRSVKSKDNTKRIAQFYHFEDRCRKRLGRVMSKKEVIRKIESGEFEFFDRQTRRVSLFTFTENDVDYIIAYDRFRHNPITILFYDQYMKNGLDDEEVNYEEECEESVQ